MDWPVDKTTDLIGMYHRTPVLWDPKHPEYKNKVKRHVALCNLCEALDVSKEELERKIKNLMGQFTRELKKISDRKWWSHGKPYESRWFGFHLLYFLKDKRNCSNIPQSYYTETDEVCNVKEETVEIIDPLFGDQDSTVLHSNINEQSEFWDEDPLNQEEEKPECKMLDLKRKRTDDQQDHSPSQPADEDSKIFGQYVTIGMQRIRSEQQRDIAKYKISKILYEGSLGKLDPE